MNKMELLKTLVEIFAYNIKELDVTNGELFKVLFPQVSFMDLDYGDLIKGYINPSGVCIFSFRKDWWNTLFEFKSDTKACKVDPQESEGKVMTIEKCREDLLDMMDSMPDDTCGDWRDALAYAIDIMCNLKDALAYSVDTMCKYKKLQSDYENCLKLINKYKEEKREDITDEQAIEHLQASGWMQAHDKALSEPYLCEDTISRQAAIDALNEVSEHYTEKGREWHPHIDFMIGAIKALPPVQPKAESCEDAVRREDALATLRFWCKHYDGIYDAIDEIKELHPVQSKAKTGYCKDCKQWKDSDGVYRRGAGAESRCPINSREVSDGNGYCYMFDPHENEDKKSENSIYQKELSDVRHSLLSRPDQCITFRDLVERFDEVDAEFNHSPWNLLQIYNNFDILIGAENEGKK